MQVKKNPKADISSWSSIFFLSGLALMLFISWQGVEWKFFETSNGTSDIVVVEDNLENEIPITEQNIPPPPPPPPPPAIAQEVTLMATISVSTSNSSSNRAGNK